MRTPAQINAHADRAHQRRRLLAASKTAAVQREQWQQTAEAIAEAVLIIAALALVAIVAFYR